MCVTYLRQKMETHVTYDNSMVTQEVKIEKNLKNICAWQGKINVDW